jgi:uncharacterized protein (TIGR02145 family)
MMFKKSYTGILLLATMFAALLLGQCSKEYGGVGMPVVKTLAPYDITTNSIRCGGKVEADNGFPVTAFGLLVSDYNDFRKYDSLSCVMEGDATFVTMLGSLKFNRRIYLRAWASNQVGTGYGEVITYTHAESGITFNPDLIYDTLTDIDGNQYRTIQIAGNEWMAENLKTTRYNDGTPIPYVEANEDWFTLSTPGYSWYMGDEASGRATYGAMYNWFTVATGKLCPVGWHVPDSSEYTHLVNHLGGGPKAGEKMKEKGTVHWLYNNLADNQSGFTALPGGQRSNSGAYLFQGFNGYLWTSSPHLGWPTESYFVVMYNIHPVCIEEGSSTRQMGHSVRCVRD